MVTYRTYAQLRGKRLTDEDKVLFTVNGDDYAYTVENQFLDTSGSNDIIFDALDIDDKDEFCEKAYGYEPGGGDWPSARDDDYAALTRAVLALFKKIEERVEKKKMPVKQKELWKPGTPIIEWVRGVLKKEKDKERVKWLRAYTHVVLPKEVKDMVEEALTVVLRKDLFDKWGINEHFEKGITNALLVYGPPGTGKTMLAETIAAVLGKGLLRISSGDLQSQVPGQTEKNIQNAFQQAKSEDLVLMFDECDSILSDRNSVGVILAAEINCLLTEIERHDGVVVMTTNRLQNLDPALQRRVIAKIQLSNPNIDARRQIWKNLLPPKMPRARDVDIEKLAKFELTGGEIKNCILLAARKAIARNKKQVDMQMFEEAVVTVSRAKQDFEDNRPRQFVPGLGKVMQND